MNSTNKLDIVLISPPYQWYLNPPLGIAYIAAYLEQNGYRTAIIDMAVSRCNSIQLRKQLEELNPTLVGITFTTPQYEDVKKICRMVKDWNHRIGIVLGGPHASAIPEDVLTDLPEVDFVVVGEGEQTTLELLDALQSEQSYHHIDGLAYREDDMIRVNKSRQLIEDLDTLPLPAWHKLAMDKYSPATTGGAAKRKTFTIITSRGCPNSCIFCDSRSVFGRRFRARSAEDIFNEILELKKRYGISQIDFVDDTITIDKDRIYQLCDLLISNNVDITWMCNARVNTVDAALLKRMHAAGCVRIDFGVESANEAIRRTLKKNITTQQIIDAHRWAKEAGMTVNSFFMVGTPGETWETIEETKNFIENLDTDYPGISIATPFPGTELYKIAKERGWLLSTNWGDYNTLAHLAKNFHPVMRNEKMSAEDIVKAYYYLNSRVYKQKVKVKYGNHFLFNPRFYHDKFFEVRNYVDFKTKARYALSVILGRFVRKGK